MNHPLMIDRQSSKGAPQKVQQVKPLETLLQVLSNVPSAIFLHEAATAKDATIDALITRFDDIMYILEQAKVRQRQVKRVEQQSWYRDSKTLGNRTRMPTKVLWQLTR